MNAPILTCPDIGAWRAWLDAESGAIAGDPETHLAACAACRGLLADLRRNAALTATLIRPLPPETLPSAPAVELARTRLHAARRSGSTPFELEPRISPFRRWRTAAAGIAAALLVVAIAATPGGRDAAAQFLAQFRPQRLEAVPLSTMQIENLEETFAYLEQIGTVEGLDALDGGPARVTSVAEAERIAGFPVKLPDPATLPAGYPAAPTEIRVIRPASVRFTFDQAKARAHYQATGQGNVSLPQRFDGAALALETPPVVLLQYAPAATRGSDESTMPLLIGQAGELTVTVEGSPTLPELREFLLSLPGLSPQTARQLRAIGDWETALPIPIPVDEVNWQRTTVAGGPGLQLGDNSGLGSVVIWQREGRIYGVGGAASMREVHRVADSIR